jgi:hypothetical protein
MAMKDNIDFVTPYIKDTKGDGWVAKKFIIEDFHRNPPAEILTIGAEGPLINLDIVKLKRTQAGDLKTVAFNDFLDLVKTGLSPTKAAKAVNLTLSRIMAHDNFRKKVAELIDTHGLSDEVRREFRKAAINKVAQDAFEAGDTKTLMEATRSMQEDDKNKGGPGVSVTVNTGLQSVFAKVELPQELQDHLNQQKQLMSGDIIEGEVEDVKNEDIPSDR